MNRAEGQQPVVIAHRGASAYLPEHTLASKALAVGLGADFLEQDVVATRDHKLVVLHDIFLDTVSDVATRFPKRKRADGRYYAVDFDLAEIQTLKLHERRKLEPDERQYPGRFPDTGGWFCVPTLRAELQMVAGMRKSMQREIGVYPEIKRPQWHQSQGIDITALVVAELVHQGYSQPDDPIFLQCFDSQALLRVRDEFGSGLPLIQLIGDNSWKESPDDYDAMLTPAGLAKVAAVADGVGPWIEQLIDRKAGINAFGVPTPSPVAGAAKDAGLLLHPYTARADDLPDGFQSLEALFGWLVDYCAISGLFTDFPDRFRNFLLDLRADPSSD